MCTEQGGKLGGREIEFVKVDDESDPAKATDNVNKLVKRDNVDVMVGTVHSGVAHGDGQGGQGHRHDADRAQRRRRRGDGCRCARPTSSAVRSATGSRLRDGRSHGQEGPQERRHHHAGSTPPATRSVGGFKEAFEKGGGKVVKELSLPFPNVEFQALLTEIAAAKPDAVYTFFRRRRRGQVRQGLRRRGPEEGHPAVRRRAS
jgi:branched-chain amino acid transport system substrate-binding protein